jgi:drug/metabolite transporter (DMT)-like permease
MISRDQGILHPMRHYNRILAPFQAILAAVFFGFSAPLAKLLLGDIDPIFLAGLLYIGSGLGTLIFRLIRRIFSAGVEKEARLNRQDLPGLLGAIIFGGVVAPIILMFSLRATPAATASLMLNFEGVATTLLAYALFHESIGGKVIIAIVLVTLASILISWQPGGAWGITLGALGVLAACFFWGLDNNFTRTISAKDPLQIVTIKGLAAGMFSCLLSLVLGKPLPMLSQGLLAMLLGSISYGLSIVLFVYAMRGLGVARTSTLFGLAPFIGMLISFLIFRDTLTVLFFIAIPLMVLGAWFLLNEDHIHTHVHPELHHEHRHNHTDGHHNHEHTEMLSPLVKNHSNLHVHNKQEHSHSHNPDIHHRHAHASGTTHPKKR